jgi:hypothetical protein
MEPATPELTKEEQKAEKQRLAAEKKAAKAAQAAKKRRIAAEKKAAKAVGAPAMKSKRASHLLLIAVNDSCCTLW